MTKLIIQYDGERIVDWRHEVDESYEPDDDDELHITEPIDPTTLDGYYLDHSTEPPTLVEDPDYDPRGPAEKALDRLDQLEQDHPVARRRIAPSTKQAFRDARDNGDIQTQLDVLFEALTGEEP